MSTININKNIKQRQREYNSLKKKDIKFSSNKYMAHKAKTNNNNYLKPLNAKHQIAFKGSISRGLSEFAELVNPSTLEIEREVLLKGIPKGKTLPVGMRDFIPINDILKGTKFEHIFDVFKNPAPKNEYLKNHTTLKVERSLASAFIISTRRPLKAIKEFIQVFLKKEPDAIKIQEFKFLNKKIKGIHAECGKLLNKILEPYKKMIIKEESELSSRELHAKAFKELQLSTKEKLKKEHIEKLVQNKVNAILKANTEQHLNDHLLKSLTDDIKEPSIKEHIGNKLKTNLDKLIKETKEGTYLSTKEKLEHITQGLTDELDENHLNKLNCTISDKEITSKIAGLMRENLLKINQQKLDKLTAGYSSAISNLGGRLFSGLPGAFFVATDFANIRRISDDDPEAAKKEFKSKLKQDANRVILTAVIGYYANSMLMKLTNNSLKAAVGLNIIIIGITEIVSRKMSNRPILPKKIGKSETEIKNSITSETDNKNNKVQTGFKDKNLVFKGNIKTEVAKDAEKATPSLFKIITNTDFINKLTMKYMKGEDFSNRMKLLHQIAPDDFKLSIKALQSFIKDGNEYKKGFEKLGKDLDNVLKKDSNVTVNDDFFKKLSKHDIPTDKKFVFKFIERIYNQAILLPFKWLDNLYHGIRNIPNRLDSILGKIANKFKTKVSGNESQLSPLQLRANALKQALDNSNPEKLKPTTVYLNNILDTIKKLETDKKFNLSELSKISDEEKKQILNAYLIETIKFNPSVQSFDASSLSTYYKATGLVSVPFLAFDAHNVAIDSGADKDTVNDKTTERIRQDLSRQGLSLYVTKSLNECLKEALNKNLGGLFVSTLLNVSTYETGTRLLNGVPVLQLKSKEEMEEMDKKNFEQKGLVGKARRFMWEATGKKPISMRAHEKNKKNIKIDNTNAKSENKNIKDKAEKNKIDKLSSPIDIKKSETTNDKANESTVK